MSKKEDLLGAFSKQIEQGTPNNPKTETKDTSQTVSTPKKQTQPKAKQVEKIERAKTKPISFYDTDFKIVRDIQEIIEEATGDRINDSSAVRLAIRSLNPNREKLVKTYKDSKQSDGRRKKVK